MTKEEYIKCYKFCLEQGWVHNTPEIDVVNEYFHSTEGRKVLFNQHLDKIKAANPEAIHILIGEAPPYYPNKEYPKTENRKYFYSEGQSTDTGYFKEPCKHFLNKDWKKNSCETKEDLLNELAIQGVLIFDIFPFPIFQSTDIREKVVWGTTDVDEEAVSTFYSSKQSMFNDYLDTHFKPRFEGLLDSFEKSKIHIYMFAPKLASVQFLYWIKEIDEWKNNLIEFNDVFEYKEEVVNQKTKSVQKFMNDSLKKFVKKLTADDCLKSKDFIDNILKKHPIFMNGSGNPDFKNFVNGKRRENNNL